MKRPLCVIAVVFVCILLTVQKMCPDMTEHNGLTESLSGEKELYGCQEKDQIQVTGIITDYRVRQYSGTTATEIILKNTYLNRTIQNKSESSQKTIQTHLKKKEKEESLDNWVQLTRLGQTICCQVAGEESYRIGSRIIVTGQLSFYKPATNPGEFDAAAFYGNRDVLFQIRNGKINHIFESYNYYRDFLFRLKEKNKATLEQQLTGEEASVLKAMLFGDKETLDEELKELYQKNGIAHILAISGLHISLLGMAFFKLLQQCGISSKPAALISEAVLLSYGAMVGFSASSFRAVLMFSLFLLAKAVKRTYDMMTAMSLGAILLLVVHPGYLFDCAFQLSFTAIWSMGCLLPAVKKLIPIRHKLLDSLLASASVWFATAPILIFHYHELSFYSVFLNLVVIPLMSFLLLSAILLLIFSWIFPPAAVLFVYPVRAILTVYKLSCVGMEALPFCRRNLAAFSLWQLFVYYGALIILTILVERIKKKYLCMMILMSVLLVLIPTSRGFCVTFLDVGQGDCAVINCDGAVYLVDGGSSSKSRVGERIIIPFLKSQGINHIDGIFLSHPDEDHMNGLVEVVANCRKENLKIGRIFIYENTLLWEKEKLEGLLLAARENGVRICEIAGGDSIRNGKLRVDCLYPEKESSRITGNEASVVLSVSCGESSLLFTGDMDNEAEKHLTDIYDREGQQYNILKVAHHGSKSSSSRSFLSWTAADFAVLSCGKNNSYGHPAPETLKRLREQGIAYGTTMEYGAIRARQKGKGFKITACLN